MNFKKCSIILLILLSILLVGCSAETTESEATMPFTVEEYTQRLKEAVEGTADSNIVLKDENIVVNADGEREEGDPLATYMITDSTGILYKEDRMHLVLSDVDTALLGDSANSLVKIFIGTVDDSLSMGDREKTLQSLKFNTDPINTNGNEVINTIQTDTYKFTYMYNAESKARIIEAEPIN